MKKIIIALVVLVSVALPVLAAGLNGAIDFDGSRAAEKAALLASWEEMDKAPAADVVIGEVTVSPAVTVLEEVTIVGTTAKAPRVAKVSAPLVCRMEGLKTDVGGQVKFCSTLSFRESVDRSEGSI